MLILAISIELRIFAESTSNTEQYFSYVSKQEIINLFNSTQVKIKTDETTNGVHFIWCSLVTVLHIFFPNALAPAKFSVLAFSRALTKAEQEQLAELATYHRFSLLLAEVCIPQAFVDQSPEFCLLHGNKINTVYWLNKSKYYIMRNPNLT